MSPRPYMPQQRPRTQRVTSHLSPDVLQHVQQHAKQHDLTLSGAVHDLLRIFFRLK